MSFFGRRVSLAALAACCLCVGSSTAVVKGISYGPMPCKGPCLVSQDDFFSQSAKPMWGRRGRGDLQVMKQLGANAVRLYGNNPENTHTDFLDEAQEFGLQAIPGLSDWEYIQSQNNCLTTNLNCSSQIKKSYLGNLQNGFLQEDGTYHPAIREIIVINEPDLKLPGMDPPKFCKGIISAIDGMLDAEKEMGVRDPKVNFTVAFSFGVCTMCDEFSNKPSLGQMAALRAAMLNPESVGYKANNDLAEFYRTRFHNSFNTNNPAMHIPGMFLDAYEDAFKTTPVMIQEYHDPNGKNVERDLKDILQIAEGSPLLNGVSFFEYSIRYDKGGSEMHFGMFEYGDFTVTKFDYFGDAFEAFCLVPAKAKESGERLPDAVAAAYGGEQLVPEDLCMPDPDKVQLTPLGFRDIVKQDRPERTQRFVERVVKHMGGHVSKQEGLAAFVSSFKGGASSPKGFEWLVTSLNSMPSWASFNHSSVCIADRDSHAPAVGNAVGYACGRLEQLDCDTIPEECKGSVWDVADYVFGAYFAEKGGYALENCYFNGTATLASIPAHLAETKSTCVFPFGKPARRLESQHWRGEEARLEDEDEASGLMVPALLASLAATLVMLLLTLWGLPLLRRHLRGSKEQGLLESPPTPAGQGDSIRLKVLPSSESSSSLKQVVVAAASSSSLASEESRQEHAS